MSTELVERGQVTDALVTFLAASTALSAKGVLVGDGVTPDAAGWPGGNSDVGSFVASVTVTTGEAQPMHRDTVAGRHASWILQYGLRSVGAARTQADNAADVARKAVLGFNGFALPIPWVVSSVLFSRLAPVNLAPGSDPPLWQLDDVVQVWVDRKRAVT